MEKSECSSSRVLLYVSRRDMCSAPGHVKRCRPAWKYLPKQVQIIPCQGGVFHSLAHPPQTNLTHDSLGRSGRQS